MKVRRTLVHQGFVFFCRHKIIVPIVEAKEQLYFIAVDLYESYERVDDFERVRFCA